MYLKHFYGAPTHGITLFLSSIGDRRSDRNGKNKYVGSDCENWFDGYGNERLWLPASPSLGNGEPFHFLWDTFIDKYNNTINSNHRKNWNNLSQKFKCLHKLQIN